MADGARSGRGGDDCYPPIAAAGRRKGGIKAQSQRGAFGESWWAQRWIAVLESFDIGGRLARGRSYARARPGARRSTIEKGKVDGEGAGLAAEALRRHDRGQAARRRPTGARWSTALAAQARLRGEAAGRRDAAGHRDGRSRAAGRVALPAQAAATSTTECSCPDWSNPCKHIAAVYYLLGEEFDRDPFLIFRLRGLDARGAGGAAQRAAPRAARGRAPSAPPAIPSEPLPADPAAFWSGGEIPPAPEVRVPETAGALLRRLGPFSFWRGKTPMTAELDPLYARAAARALDIFVGSSR